ncbi:hypothetical protein LguiA_020622 [Lonicera macranthoides]
MMRKMKRIRRRKRTGIDEETNFLLNVAMQFCERIIIRVVINKKPPPKCPQEINIHQPIAPPQS